MNHASKDRVYLSWWSVLMTDSVDRPIPMASNRVPCITLDVGQPLSFSLFLCLACRLVFIIGLSSSCTRLASNPHHPSHPSRRQLCYDRTLHTGLSANTFQTTIYYATKVHIRREIKIFKYSLIIFCNKIHIIKYHNITQTKTIKMQ